ncbi:TIM barrel protein [Sporolactobacillus shoreicorticis]|uniref:Sugar phosphate isomerase/epimerase family protein n=1 Tax=Sporolactobacillus shoreicorticis TaxID=1923877 RepID=A0ABW5S015_9BACL|nr:TIM barrel protein [Sporolactobacillus shoreicorticis]MCO7128100.1 TIM barrel protein [Sporolactobacillus shoreicorticis]
MMKEVIMVNPLYLNTLVFKKQLDAGQKSQSDLFQTAQVVGVSGIEVRREYFENDLLEDMDRCGEQAEQTGSHVLYSVPEKLFENGVITSRLNDYFQEAETLHAENIKLNIGEPMNLSADDLERLKQMIKRYAISLTIENDQTAENGKLDFVNAALKKLSNSPIGYTFDLGNWLWQKTDPLEAARQVGSYATIFHLKDVSTKNGLKTELLGNGTIDWVRALNECPSDIPVVVEYPIDSPDLLKVELAKVKQVLSKQKEGAQS